MCSLDRGGVKYASNDYVQRLTARKIAISMSRPANPYDNAKAESFMKTLKTEEVNGKTYKDLSDARARVGEFIDTVYNAKRFHSVLGYKATQEFEAELGWSNKGKCDIMPKLPLN